MKTGSRFTPVITGITVIDDGLLSVVIQKTREGDFKLTQCGSCLVVNKQMLAGILASLDKIEYVDDAE